MTEVHESALDVNVEDTPADVLTRSDPVEVIESEEIKERPSLARNETPSALVETTPADDLEEQVSTASCRTSDDEQKEHLPHDDPELMDENAELMVTFRIRIAELETRLEGLKADDARRAAEIEQIRISNETRFLALENKVAEIQSRVLLLQASLVSSGTVIQSRKRA
ncbi:hypothetical protein GALMADRAFT_235647 [Galerina marginata CBS 339.88]|uniref:Uncharacterized protein n=1 Tax=Galerina marginata (strain CBS 339.88) TaxID=685588 RepID=A0A067TUC2_GALM3|nr:hypothetical protein GALMADRAFT_235647 [Galerina marginata CBS 339.88]